MAKTNLNEDKIALLTGCFIFLLAALNLAHLDVLGWVVSTNMWTSMDKAFSATTGAYKETISGVVSLLCTYVALTALLSLGIKLLGGNVARFPRFVLGYLMTFVIMLVICVNVEWQPLGKSVISTLGPLRTIFFTLTFFTIGMVSNFHKLMEEGIGRLAIVYVVCLFGFIIWLGLFISWLFFHGMTPPVIAG